MAATNRLAVNEPRRDRAVAIALVTLGLALPATSPAESNLVSGGRTLKGGASAHLDFRIIIPPVLGLSVVDRDLSAENVEIFSNGRHVTVDAAPPTATTAAASPAGTVPATGRRFVLRASRGRVILETTACQVAAPRALAHRAAGFEVIDTRPVVCTVAMP